MEFACRLKLTPGPSDEDCHLVGGRRHVERSTRKTRSCDTDGTRLRLAIQRKVRAPTRRELVERG